MNAREIMSASPLWTCREGTDCLQAARLMCQNNVGSIPVVDNAGTLIGIITDRDICCRVIAAGQSDNTPVGEVMSKDVHSVQQDASLEEIHRVMQDFQVRRVPVIDRNNRLVGMIALADIAHACFTAGQYSEGLTETLEAVSSPPIHSK